MTDIKDQVKDKVETAKDVASNIESELETVAHNTVHPSDETDKQARRRQPWMPIAGVALIGIILMMIYAFFYR